jgi:hypothetical protein
MRSMKKAQAKKASSPKKSSTGKPRSGVNRSRPGGTSTRSEPKRAKDGRTGAKSGKGSAKAATKRASAGAMPPRRADFGKPIDGFFAKQPPQLRSILEALRKLVEEVAPDAVASIKWGMPFYTVGGTMMCALGGHRSHVNLILAGPPGTFDDPERRLQGEGKTGRRLTLHSIDELPRDSVRRWVKSALRVARS